MGGVCAVPIGAGELDPADDPVDAPIVDDPDAEPVAAPEVDPEVEPVEAPLDAGELLLLLHAVQTMSEQMLRRHSFAIMASPPKTKEFPSAPGGNTSACVTNGYATRAMALRRPNKKSAHRAQQERSPPRERSRALTFGPELS
ncbi:MAG TPA: hypothetical protein VGY54_14695 [Polyangiaceae bacterium]|jgi:hypothetical protein|nr:hypothetical protein [Polyangiaceae bacterium]